MANKIGIVLALDGEQKFAQGMRNAQQASKRLDAELKSLKNEFKDSASSMEYMSKRQELLKQKEEAYQRTLTAAKTGQSNAKKAYKEQAQALEDLESQLKKAQEALSKMSSGDSGYAKQAREVEKLNAAVDKQTANYLKAEGRLSSWDAKVNRAEADIRKNNTALEKNASDMNRSSSEASNLAGSMDDVGNSAKGAAGSIDEVGISLSSMVKAKAVDLAGDAIRSLGQKAIEAAKFAIEVGSEFEASMSEVEAISGASGVSLEQLGNKAKQLGRTTKFSASEVAQAYKYMGMAGWDAGQMISGVDGILNLAAASGEELATTSDIVTDDLTAFGMAADQAGRMADVLAAASTSSNTNVSLLGETFKYAGAVAGSFGYTLEDVSIAAGLMANAGIKGTQAGTALRSIFTRLATDAGASSTKLGALGTLTEKLGVQFYKSDGSMRDFKDVLVDMRGAWNGLSQEQQTNYAKTIAGQNALSGFLALMNAEQGDFDKLSSAIENSSGAAEKMAGVMQDNLKGAMTEFGSAAESLGIAVYDIFDDAITDLVDLGTGAVSTITDALTLAPDTTPLDDYMAAIAQAQTDAEGIVISPTLAVMDIATDDPTGLEEYLKGILDSGDEISAMSLNPDTSGLQRYIDEVKEAGESLNNTREAANAYVGETVNQAAVIGALGDRLIRLNEIEDKSNTQRYEMRTLVQELSQFIPELADAYDEESGRINKTTKEVEALIKAKQRQMILDAQAASQQEVINKLYEAESKLMKAEEARAAAWENRKAAVDQAQQLRDMHQEYNDLTDVINGVIYATDEEKEAALIRRGEISKEVESLGILVTSETSWQDAIADSEAAEQAAIKQHDEAYDAYRTLRKGVKEATEELGDQPGIIERVMTAMGLMEDETEKAAEGEEKVAESAEESKNSVISFGEAVKNVTGALKGMDDHFGISEKMGAAFAAMKENLEAAVEAAKRYENASIQSAQNVRDAWKNMVEEARGSLSFDLFSDFNGGTDQTVEEMNAHMQSQIEGLQNYAENLQTVSQHVGKEISPEFMEYLESMGTEGANVLQHIVKTLEQDNGSELLQQWSDGYAQAMNMQDQISLMIAGDKAALTDGLRSLGSSDADFSVLSNTIDSALAGADTELQAKIQELVSTAQSVGATIPEGLTESIANGDVDATEISSQLNASIQGAMDGLIDVAKECGVDVPEGLSEAIADGTEDVQAAYDSLIESIATSGNVSDTMTEAAKTTFTTPLANGVREGQEEVVTALTEVTEAAAAAVQTDAFGTAGQDAAKKFSTGITSGVTQANAAGKTLADVARIAANNTVGEWQGVGVNMAAGLATGIALGQSQAIGAAANMAVQALAIAKAKLEIKSPSKKFQKEVGRQIGKGMAFGIRQSAKDTTAEAESLSNKTLAAASKWITKYNKEHKQKTKARLENERYFWQQVSKVTKKGTDAYYTAMVKSGFGVSWFKTTGSGKNKKTVKKDAETYYGEVYSAAQDFFDRLTMNQDMSIKSELAYWQKVQSGLKKGTAAYVQAAQKIKSIKEKIGGFDVAADILDSFQIYQDMSEKAVMDYWDLIRRQYETGTEDRMKADEKYLDAKKRYNEKLKDLEQDYADSVAEKNKELAEAIEDRMANIAGAYDLFEEYTSEAATGKELLFNIQTQAEGYKFWREQLQALEARGILGSNLMGELSEKGPNESAAIYALNSLSDEELAAYNQAYQQKMDLARLQATEDEKDLAAKISDEIESLTDEYSKQLSATNENLNTQMASLAGSIKSIASDQTAQIVAAIVNQGATAQQAVAQVQQQQADNQAAAQAAAAAQAEQAAQQAAQQKKILQDKIMAVVSGGKKTSKTNSDYGQLRNYVISKFGYDIGSYQNGNTLYQKLGKIFGLSVNKTATGPQRTAILNALKAAGFRHGTRRVPVWMDEDGPGSEMVISRSDNAILTRVPAGSAIAPANLTDNLWQWGAFSPAQFLAQMDRRQAAMTAYVERMVGSTVSMAGLNNRLATVNAVPAAGGGFSGEGLLQRMFDLMAEYLPHIEDTRNTYLDKDLVTKAMSDNVSRDMAMRSRRVRQ